MNSLVSIIIPCYNGENYIAQTIQSVLNQSYRNFEIIFINDGSTDSSEQIIASYLNDVRVKYYYQLNQGVSFSRNYGLTQAKGEYILFLDADDILENDFLKWRILFLQNSSYYTACCTSIQIINEEGIKQSTMNIGVHDNIILKIFNYQFSYATCPSNFLFKRKILIENNLLFNTHLSSSADRLFLLECSQYFKFGLIYNDYNARLLYRLHNNNMSRNISIFLLKDNRNYFKKVLELNYIPYKDKKTLKFKIYYILSGGYYKLQMYRLSSFYAVFSIFVNPIKFIKQIK
jgi:glycosyltransferase involved in cell wall biosynthesis